MARKPSLRAVDKHELREAILLLLEVAAAHHSPDASNAADDPEASAFLSKVVDLTRQYRGLLLRETADARAGLVVEELTSGAHQLWSSDVAPTDRRERVREIVRAAFEQWRVDDDVVDALVAAGLEPSRDAVSRKRRLAAAIGDRYGRSDSQVLKKAQSKSIRAFNPGAFGLEINLFHGVSSTGWKYALQVLLALPGAVTKRVLESRLPVFRGAEHLLGLDRPLPEFFKAVKDASGRDGRQIAQNARPVVVPQSEHGRTVGAQHIPARVARAVLLPRRIGSVEGSECRSGPLGAHSYADVVNASCRSDSPGGGVESNQSLG